MTRLACLAVSALLGLAAASAAFAQGRETLGDALAAAYRNSNLIDQQAATLRAADEDVAQAVASLRPVVDFVARGTASRLQTTASGAFSDTASSSAELATSLTILDFGRRRLGAEVQRETVLATRAALNTLEQDVLFSAVSAYVNAQVTGEIVAIRQANLRLLTQEYRAAQDRFDVGEITRTDVALAEARLAAARAALAAAEGDFMVSRENYRLAIGTTPETLAPLPEPPDVPETIEAAEAIARTTHPAIMQAQHIVRVRDLAVDLAKAGYLPVLSASLSARSTGDGVASGAVNLALSQTLYSGGARQAAVRGAIAEREAARAGLDQAVLTRVAELGAVWARLDVAGAQVRAGDLQIRAAQIAFDGLREEAKLGARTTLDVLNAEQELLNARVARLQAQSQRYLGVYEVLRATGLLTVDHLGLDVPRYDPTIYYNAVKNAPMLSPQGKRLDRILEKLGR